MTEKDDGRGTRKEKVIYVSRHMVKESVQGVGITSTQL